MAAIVFPTPVSERHGLSHWTDCAFCSAVMLANVASNNAKPATWEEAHALRIASGDPVDNAGPEHVERAFRVRYGWDLPRYSGGQSQLIAEIRAGSWGILYYHYNLWPYALKQQKNFYGGHASLFGPTNLRGVRQSGSLWVVDPLFVPNSGYEGQWVPESVLARAMMGSLGNVARPGQFAAPAHPPFPHVRCLEPFFTAYIVRKLSDTPLVLQAIGGGLRPVYVGAIIAVSMREYPVTMGNGSMVNLREIASGPYAGQWLSSHGSTPFSL